MRILSSLVAEFSRLKIQQLHSILKTSHEANQQPH
jgi:hypothetical protein